MIDIDSLKDKFIIVKNGIFIIKKVEIIFQDEVLNDEEVAQLIKMNYSHKTIKANLICDGVLNGLFFRNFNYNSPLSENIFGTKDGSTILPHLKKLIEFDQLNSIYASTFMEEVKKCVV